MLRCLVKLDAAGVHQQIAKISAFTGRDVTYSVDIASLKITTMHPAHGQESMVL